MPVVLARWKRLVFKSRTTERGRFVWRLHVLDLKTGNESVVNESRSVDDQAEWLDGEHVLYALPTECRRKRDDGHMARARRRHRHAPHVCSRCFISLCRSSVKPNF